MAHSSTEQHSNPSFLVTPPTWVSSVRFDLEISGSNRFVVPEQSDPETSVHGIRIELEAPYPADEPSSFEDR